MALSSAAIVGQQVKALNPGAYDDIEDEVLGQKLQANPIAMAKFQDDKQRQEADRTAEENKPGLLGRALEAVSPISQYPGVIADYALTGGKNISVDENAPFLSGGIRLDKNIGQHARELVERGAAAAATGDIGQLNTYEPYAGEEAHVRKAVAEENPVLAGTEAVLGTVGEKAVDFAGDPLLWTLGGAGQIASRGGQAAGLLKSGAAASPQAAAALAKLASQGKLAGAVATGAGAAFVPGMVEGAIHEGGEASTKFAEGDTVGGLEAGTSGVIDALFAALGVKHTAGAVRGGLASRGQKPVATEGAPDQALTGPRHFTVDAPASAVNTIKGQAAKAAAELVGGGAGAMAASAIGLPSFVGRAPGGHLALNLADRLTGKAGKTVPLQAGVPKALKGVPEMEIDAGLSPFDELIRTQRAEEAGTVQAPGMSSAGEFGRPFNEFEMTEAVSNVDRMIGERQEAERAAEAEQAGAPLDPIAQAQAELKQLSVENRLKAEKLKSAELAKKEAEAQRIAELEAEHPDLPGLVENLTPPNGPLPYAKAVEQARAALGLPPKAAAAGPTTPGALSPEEAAAGVAANDPFQTAENIPAGEVASRLPQDQSKFPMTPEEQNQLIGMLAPEVQALRPGAPERLAGEVEAADPFQTAANVPAGEVVPTMKAAGVPEPEVSKGEARAKELGIERNEIDNHAEYDRTVAEWQAGTLTTRKKVDGAVQDVPIPQNEQGAKQMRAIARSRAVEAITAEREAASKQQTAGAAPEQQFAQFKEQAMGVIEQLKGNEGAIRAHAVKLGYPKEVIDRMLPELLAEYRAKKEGAAVEPLSGIEGQFAGVRGQAPDLLEQMKAEAAKTVQPPAEPAVNPIEAARQTLAPAPAPAQKPAKTVEKAPEAAPRPAAAPQKAAKPAEPAKAPEKAPTAPGEPGGDRLKAATAALQRGDVAAARELVIKSNPDNKMKLTIDGKELGVGDLYPSNGQMIIDVEEGGFTLLKKPKAPGSEGRGRAYSVEATESAEQRGGAASSETPKAGRQYSIEGDFVAVPRKPRATAQTELDRLKNESEGRGGLTPPDPDTVRPFADDYLSVEDLKRHQPTSKGEKQYGVEPDKLGFYSQAEKVISDPKAPKKQHGKAWDSYLRSPQRGVTKDEMYWTGLEDFLRENANKPVTSEQIAQHLKANKVEIIEHGTDPAAAPLPEAKVTNLNAYSTMVRAKIGNDLVEAMITKSSMKGDETWWVTHPRSHQDYSFESRAEAVDAATQMVNGRVKELSATKTFSTKHSSYQAEGEGQGRPKNYREIRITVPRTREGENTFVNGNHYEEVGVVTSFRVNERMSEGPWPERKMGRTLFVEEIQSDAGSAAKHGTRKDIDNLKMASDAAAEAVEARRVELRDKYGIATYQSAMTAAERAGYSELQKKWEAARDAYDGAAESGAGAPDNAPFIATTQKYTELAVKRLMRIAAEEGFDRIAWTTGKQQSKRWSLTNAVDEIVYNPKTETLTAFKGGEERMSERVAPNELAQYIGGAAAEKLLAQPESAYTIAKVPDLTRPDGTTYEAVKPWRVLNSEGKVVGRSDTEAFAFIQARDLSGRKRLKGADLDVGDRWAYDYYDKVIPSSFEKVGRRFGAKVEPTAIEFTRQHEVIRSPYGFWVADGVGNPIKWEDFESANDVTIGRPEGRTSEVGNRHIDRDYFENRKDADAFATKLDSAASTTPADNVVQSVTITPEMRDSIMKEGFPQYKGEPKAQGEWKPPTMAEVKKNLPKGLAEKLVKYSDGSYEIETPRGVIRIIPEKKIQVDLEALERGREGAAAAYERGDISISGEKSTFGGEAIVRAVRAGVLPHEVGGHVWLDHFASPKQRQFLRNEFEAEAKKLKKDWREVMADAYSDYHKKKLDNPGWEPTSRVGQFVQSIYNFLHGLYNNFRPSVAGTFEQVRTGKEFDKAPVSGSDTGLVPQYAAGPRGPRTATADAISRLRDTKQARPGVKGILETQKVDLTPRIAKPKEKGQYNVEMREKVKAGEEIPIKGTGKGGKVLVEDIAKHLHKDTLKRLGEVTGEEPTKILERALQHADREVGYQLDTGRSGKDWYKSDIEKLDNDLRRVFPELKEKSPEKTMFKTVVALLSPNTKPNDNLMRAARLWDAWKDTGFDPAALPIKRPAYLIQEGQAGQWGRGSEQSFLKMQRLLKQEGSIEAAVKWMEAEHSVRAMRDAGWGDFKHRKIDETVTGFEAFGPKVGQFVQNLEGNAGKLTVDKWFMRTWGRYMGTLIDNNGLLRETPLESQRPIMEEMSRKMGEKYKMDPADVQATLWYYEQQLYQDLGAKIREVSYGESAAEVAQRIEEGRAERRGPKGKGGTPEGGGTLAEGSGSGRVPEGGFAEGGGLEKKVSGGISRLDQFETIDKWYEHHRNLGFSDKELREAIKNREGTEPLEKLTSIGKVKIARSSGPHEVDAFDSGVPSIAITPHSSGKGYTITHVPTGMTFGAQVPKARGEHLKTLAGDIKAIVGDAELGTKDFSKRLTKTQKEELNQAVKEFEAEHGVKQKSYLRPRFPKSEARESFSAFMKRKFAEERKVHDAMVPKTGEQSRELARKDPVGYVLENATNYLFDNMFRVSEKTGIGKQFGERTKASGIYEGAYVPGPHETGGWSGKRNPAWLGQGGKGELLVSRAGNLLESTVKMVKEGPNPSYEQVALWLEEASKGDPRAIAKLKPYFKTELKGTLAHEILHGYEDTRDTFANNPTATKVMQDHMNKSAEQLLHTETENRKTLSDELDQYFDSVSMDPHWEKEIQTRAESALKLMKKPEGANHLTLKQISGFAMDAVKTAGRTAMSRSGPSAPAKLFVGDVKGKSVIDWGAGRGADVAFYKKSGAKDVQGYDPNHSPEKPKGKADIVTNTFVANVLPPKERHAMLREAFSHAKEKLIVSARADKIPGKPKEDGVVTATGTFQKSYKSGELVTELQKLFGGEATVTAMKGPSGASMAVVTRKVPLKK